MKVFSYIIFLSRSYSTWIICEEEKNNKLKHRKIMHAALNAFLCVSTVLLTGQLTNGRYQGILINGVGGGTQLYDPFNTPHARVILNSGLQTGIDTIGGAAVIIGDIAYFGGGYQGGSKFYV